MSKKFAEYSKLDLSNVNKEVLKKWQDGDIFHKSLEIREGHPSFVFYEGPPSANGMQKISLIKRYARYSPCDCPFD